MSYDVRPFVRKVKIMAKKKKVIDEVAEAIAESIDEKIAEEIDKETKKSAPKKKKTEEKPEAIWIYHTGDSLDKISFELTGKKYMIYRILQYSGLNMNTLKDGDVLKWGL